jgi:hypothetical protein
MHRHSWEDKVSLVTITVFWELMPCWADIYWLQRQHIPRKWEPYQNCDVLKKRNTIWVFY